MRLGNILFIISCLVSLSGCLQTRADLAEEDEQKKMQSTVTTLQKSRADEEARFDSIDASLRDLTGRIETAEHKSASVHESMKADIVALQKKTDDILAQMKIFDDTLLKAHQRIDALEKQLAANQEAAAQAAAEKETKKTDHFAEGEQHYQSKEWKKAIAAYQKYRDASPKGKDVPMATLRMGISFQELGMKAEAKSFFQEVIEKYPKDKAAKIAGTRLKQLKK